MEFLHLLLRRHFMGKPVVVSAVFLSLHIRESKTVLDSGFQVPMLVFVSGTWIPDSNLKWDSGSLELYSGF